MNAGAGLGRPAPDPFQLALEAAPTGMLVIDAQGLVILANAQAERTFGYEHDELLGQPIESLVPRAHRERHPTLRSDFAQQPRARPMGAGRDLYGCRRDGSEVPIEIGLSPIQTAEGRFVIASVIDISARRKIELERERLVHQLETLNAELEERVQIRTADLSATLREREVLLEEVHHRVKNNLCVIYSLIAMQARSLEPGSARDALDQCQRRVQAIALVHEKLYQSHDYARVPFSDYVHSLAAEIFHAMGLSTSHVSLDLSVEPMTLGVDKAIPCALILNELITNSLKHAFPEHRAGTLRVRFDAPSPALARLVVQDDGVGLPDRFDLSETTSLGLQLVSTLGRQLDAEVRLDGRHGVCVEVTFAT